MYKMPKTNAYADSYLVILNEPESGRRNVGADKNTRWKQ